MFSNETIEKFGAEILACGVTEENLKTLLALSDKSWLQKSATEWLARVNKPLKWTPVVTKSYHDAKVIMGRNFLGIEEVEQAFGVKYSSGDRAKLAQVPFDEVTLKTCAKTYVLVAGFPMSINDIRQKVRGNAARLFYSALGDAWFEREQFAQIAVGVRWFLLRKEPVQNSTSKTYGEQEGLIPQNEEIPFARDVVFATVALFVITGERLFENVYVRCRDVSSGGRRVLVGDFDRGGLRINGYWDVSRYVYLGACSFRNSN
jgi:hypothetical protein